MGQLKPAAAIAERLAFTGAEHSEELPRRDGAGLGLIATDEDMAVPRLRDILHGNGCTALMSSDSSGFPGTTDAPESTPAIHPARVSSVSPPLLCPFSEEWHSLHRSTSNGRMFALKKATPVRSSAASDSPRVAGKAKAMKRRENGIAMCLPDVVESHGESFLSERDGSQASLPPH
jgi:hypothetical protein